MRRKRQKVEFLNFEEPNLLNKFWLLLLFSAIIIVGLFFALTFSGARVVLKSKSTDQQTSFFRDSCGITVLKDNPNIVLSNLLQNNSSEKSYVREFWLFFLAFVMGFIGNLLSELIWRMWLDKRIKNIEPKKINAIKAVADKDLIETILNGLDDLKGGYFDYLDIKMTLKCVSDTKLVRCSVTYDYSKILRHDITSFDFNFVRLKLAKDKNANLFKKKHGIDFTNFYFIEESILENDKKHLDTKDAYSVNYLKVNEEYIESEKLKREEKSGARNATIISYSANNLKPNKGKLNIQFEISFYLEMESYFSFDIEEPTKNLWCNLKYDTDDKLEIYSEHSISSSDEGDELDSPNHQTITYTLDNTWIYPGSKLLFIWYEKQDPKI